MASLLAGLFATSAAAAPYVPPDLEPWRGWVLDAHPDLPCPGEFGRSSARHCVWPYQLDVRVGDTGAEFVLAVEAFAEGSVTIPGSSDLWPIDVRLNGQPAVVAIAEDTPAIAIAAGRHRIEGRIPWQRQPETLRIPAHHGLLALSVDGAPVPHPLVEGGTLWLGRAAEPDTARQDSIEAHVYRRLADGVPLVLETLIDITVGGSHRIEVLGHVLPDGFEATAIASPLPARLDAEGVLKAQVQPGQWRIAVTARALATPGSITTPDRAGHWPAQEIWAFAPNRALRVVSIEGPPSIDPSQTQSPYQGLPSFLLGPGEALRFVEELRGDPNPTPNSYHLERSLWLTFEGDAFVVQDRFTLTAQRPTRLAATFLPGRITVDGTPTLITTVAGGAPGIELPQGDHTVEAVSELPRHALDRAVGWEVGAESVRATLNLPPAHRLLWTRGVDRAPTAWLSRWTVWSLFLVLVSTVASARLLGRSAAALTAITLTLVYHESGAPVIVWIVLLALLAGLRVSQPGRFRSTLRGLYALILAVTAVAVIGFAIDDFRKALYPQLERPDAFAGERFEYSSREDVAPDARRGARSEAMLDQAQEILVTASKESAPPAFEPRYVPGLEVQTGPAVPRWTWEQAPLVWDGPVTADQPLSLTIAPPWAIRALYIVGPVLLLALTVVFGLAALPPTVSLPPQVRRFTSSGSVSAAAAVMLAVAAWLPAGGAHADPPGNDLLQELERRLTEPPDCAPGCAAYERVTLRLDARTLAIEATVHAAATVAVALPGGGKDWRPESARVDGRVATVRRDDAGGLFVALSPGVAVLTLAGSVAHLDRLELEFPIAPGQVEVDADGWQVFGLDEGRLQGRTLQFARIETTGDVRAAASLRPDPVKPYFRISREIVFGIEWRTTTVVSRVAPLVGSLPFEVALLSGESVLGGNVVVTDGRATGVLEPDESERHFESTVAIAPTLSLTAPALPAAAAEWTLVPTNHWHVEASGIVPIKIEAEAARGPRFAPLPGETLTVSATRPEAVPGATVTVEHVGLTDQQGGRTRRTTLAFDVLSSQGGTYAVTPPQAASVVDIRVNGRPEPIPRGEGVLQIPVVPGSQAVEVTWEAETPVAWRTHTSPVQFATPTRNISLVMELSGDRWLLFVGGPAMGPAVLYWGVMVLVVIFALALARVPGMPLSRVDAVLLGLGMTLCNLPSTVLVAAWLVLLLARRRAADRLAGISVTRFQLLQVVLAILSIAAVIALAASVPAGLLGAPDMHIVGNGSSAAALRWFQDAATETLPAAWVVSLPLFVYRLSMLAWSLWLAFALIRWVRWSWDAYSAGGAWRKRSTRRAKPPPEPETSAAAPS